MRRAKTRDPYGGRDPREMPTYQVSEAAHYLWVPERTIETWVFGRSFRTNAGERRSKPLVPADAETRLLSFVNLLELHVLAAIRREHGVTMQRIRQAIHYLEQKWGRAHPLIDEEMETDGTGLFVRKLGTLIEVSSDGQLAMESVLEAHLQRIERDAKGLAVRLYPFTRKRAVGHADAPRLVSIDPRYAFGRPVIAGSRIPTAEIAERFWAGDSFEELVTEYGRQAEEISEAIRCEWWRAAA